MPWQVYGDGTWRYPHDAPSALLCHSSAKRARRPSSPSPARSSQGSVAPHQGPAVVDVEAALQPPTGTQMEMVMERSRLVATCYASASSPGESCPAPPLRHAHVPSTASIKQALQKA